MRQRRWRERNKPKEMPMDDAAEAAAPTNETPLETPDVDAAEAEPAPGPDLVRIAVDLPRKAVDALVDTGYLQPGERDDGAAIGGALLAYLSEAWIRGVREPAPREDDADEVAQRKADFHRRLASVNAE
jgi:hypothetical protein